MKRLLRFLLPIALLTCVSLPVVAAHASEPDAAPFAGKCFGDGTSTCLVPELSFNVSRIALNGPDQWKLGAGAVPLGAGYALLFGYDQWWASGPAVHGIVDLSQGSSPNVFQLAGMVTICRYAHAGVVWSHEGGATAWHAAVGLTLPIDVVTTTVAERKAKAVRALRAAGPPAPSTDGQGPTE
jgi:hypothetical protein